MGRPGWSGRDGVAGRLGFFGDRVPSLFAPGQRLLSAAAARAPQAPGGRLAPGVIGDCTPHQCLACGARGDTCPLPLPSPSTALGWWRLRSRSVHPGDQEGGGAPGMERWFLGRPRDVSARGTRASALSTGDAVATVASSSPGKAEEQGKTAGRNLVTCASGRTTLEKLSPRNSFLWRVDFGRYTLSGSFSGSNYKLLVENGFREIPARQPLEHIFFFCSPRG